MAVWVRILGLPFSYFKECTLNNIGNLLGTVVKIDKLTLAQARGKFGRLCIEIDLQKPLRPYVEVDGLAYSVVYEGISMICFNCGCYGHVKANCSLLNGSSDTTKHIDDIQTNMEGPADKNNDTTMDSSGDACINPNDSSAASTPAPILNSHDSLKVKFVSLKGESETKFVGSGGGHGPWMLMSYKNKKVLVSNAPNNKAPAQTGSRFALLQTFSEGEDGALREEAPTNVEELFNKSTPVEPPIVKLWKKVQEKNKKNLGTTQYMPTDPIPAKVLNKPLKDITNGKNQHKHVVKSGTARTPRTNAAAKASSSQSREMTSFIIDSPIKPQFSTPILTVNNVPKPSCVTNTSAVFGHCSLEISGNENIPEDNMDVALICNGQAFSDFADGKVNICSPSVSGYAMDATQSYTHKPHSDIIDDDSPSDNEDEDPSLVSNMEAMADA
ncbi:hypothetical protein M0R45_009897 [Rubus argutus]|uniref:CCHC-type domain-containing protein n=1 Tax=Rubus argutus TaxID=59490 RepID=A0AAW1Y7Y8_RUBAR